MVRTQVSLLQGYGMEAGRRMNPRKALNGSRNGTAPAVGFRPSAIEAGGAAPSSLDCDFFTHRRWRLPEAELPRVDIVLVLSNAAEHLEKLLTAVAKLAYPPEKLRLALVDNPSTDHTAG